MRKIWPLLRSGFMTTVPLPQKVDNAAWDGVTQVLEASVEGMDASITRLHDEISKLSRLDVPCYEELRTMQINIDDYQKVKTAMKRQLEFIKNCSLAYYLFDADIHFTRIETGYMSILYSGIVQHSVHQLEQLLLGIISPVSTMSDETKLKFINGVVGCIDENLNDLREFNQQFIILRLQRARDKRELEKAKAVYARHAYMFAVANR